MNSAKVTERTFYPPMIEMINNIGGSGISEVQYASVPDIVFEIQDFKCLLSVKIGQDSKTMKDAFIQYMRHKEDSNIENGMIVFFPEIVRKTIPSEISVRNTLNRVFPTVLIDIGLTKEEISDKTFPHVLDFIKYDVLKKGKPESHYSLPLVIKLLQEQVSEMMNDINIEEQSILSIITDKSLLMDLGDLDKKQTESVARFLASYILMSQILFLRLLVSAIPGIITGSLTPVSISKLRWAFNKVLEINYKPIFEIDVFPAIKEKFVQDTFILIWGLNIERVRYELPGRIFHELMPSFIRKMMASFYTRPIAADMLSRLSIQKSSDTIFDPACGSGTILSSAYKIKKELYVLEKKAGNPHKRMAEEEIYGVDIMPFAVHLTSANIAAMDPSITISRTQIIEGDSLGLDEGKTYASGLVHEQTTLFPKAKYAKTFTDDRYEINLDRVDVILMNPPFTKVERGIKKFCKMERFKKNVGGEVGLWGHFIELSKLFLLKNGIFGGVIPINILRGRESEKVRNSVFFEWTPLYVIKPTLNYGFSEWSEYRDILIVAKNTKCPSNHNVKFCLIKKDLTQLSQLEAMSIPLSIKTNNNLRTEILDIDSVSISNIKTRLRNLMWFFGGISLDNRDVNIGFIEKIKDILSNIPDGHFREGFRPVPKGVSKFLFATRSLDSARTEQAFLQFSNENNSVILAETALGTKHQLLKKHFVKSIRTLVGYKTMNITNNWDYLAFEEYENINKICQATNQPFPTSEYWERVKKDTERIFTKIVVSHRINPFSPSVNINSVYSEQSLTPSNQVNVIIENDDIVAKALCVILNSIIFYSQFFLLKEESTGRYINIRFYDLEEMYLYPSNDCAESLSKVYEKYKNVQFKSLKDQFDKNFDWRYADIKETKKEKNQIHIFSMKNQPIEPSDERLMFDIEVCKAIGLNIQKSDILTLYEIIVSEMLQTKHLSRD